MEVIMAVKTTDTLKANIGLTNQQRDGVIEILNARLADTVTLYVKTRKYHWNVRGIHFAELHEFFEEQYDQLEEAMDEIAERVRQVGGISIGTLDEFKSLTSLQEQPGVNPDAHGMIRDLLNDHEAVIQQLRKDVDTTADECHDLGTSDFLTGLMEDHEKMAWMLRSHLEGEDHD
jgi:starvation-inducible DNA-binding protein